MAKKRLFAPEKILSEQLVVLCMSRRIAWVTEHRPQVCWSLSSLIFLAPIASFKEAFVLIYVYLRMLLVPRALFEQLTVLLRWAGGWCPASTQVSAGSGQGELLQQPLPCLPSLPCLPCHPSCPAASRDPRVITPAPGTGAVSPLPALAGTQPARSHAQHGALGTRALQRSERFRQRLSINCGGVKAGWRRPPRSRASFLSVYTPVSRQIPE